MDDGKPVRKLQKSDLMVSGGMTILSGIFAFHTYSLNDSLNSFVFTFLTIFGSLATYVIYKTYKAQ